MTSEFEKQTLKRQARIFNGDDSSDDDDVYEEAGYVRPNIVHFAEDRPRLVRCSSDSTISSGGKGK